MKPTFLVALIAIVAAPAARASGQAAATRQATQQIEQLEQHGASATPKKDIPGIEALLADDFCITTPVGRNVPRDDYLNAIKDGTFHVESLKLDDMKVRVYGDAAVVTGTMEFKGDMDGNDISGDYALTDTLVKRSGKWRKVAEQVTRVND